MAEKASFETWMQEHRESLRNATKEYAQFEAYRAGAASRGARVAELSAALYAVRGCAGTCANCKALIEKVEAEGRHSPEQAVPPQPMPDMGEKR